MYDQSYKSFLNRSIFILFDLICLNIAFIVAYELRIGGPNPYTLTLYRDMIIILCLCDFAVVTLFGFYAGIERRGYYKEFNSLILQTGVVFLLGLLYLYSVKEAEKFSQITFGIMGISFFILNYYVRIVVKRRLTKRVATHASRSLLVVTTEQGSEELLSSLFRTLEREYVITGAVILDRDMTGSEIINCPVVSDAAQLPAYVCRNWVDDVLIITDSPMSIPQTMLDDLSQTGVVIHVGAFKRSNMLAQKQFVSEIGDYKVVTTCMNQAVPVEILLKRALDIIAGVFGCLITGVLYVILFPFVQTVSPGPMFFTQLRVGRNGKKFKMYKFRSMVVEAEERKKELVTANRVRDGMMFKMDFDPRIIGNRILPDGTKKTGIGSFIRKTSIDEFPQFFNVLKGDMSLVGTRPPTEDEWERYKLHHRARMAIKPGITGLWQVSGRSNITDFEEVVALDTKYINEWSLGQDIKILLKTVRILFSGDGAM